MDDVTYGIIGAAMEVHSSLGPGFWRRSTKKLFRLSCPRRIPFSRETETAIFYKGKELKTSYRSDFIFHGCIIVELKAISKLGDIEKAQVLNYLRATGFRKGLLFNFGAQSLEKRRLVM
jgi:GxxExxY protein